MPEPVSLTDAGRTYFDDGVRIVHELEAAESAVGSLRDKPSGLLRVTALLNAAWLGDIVVEFMKRYPLQKRMTPPPWEIGPPP